MHLTSVKLNNFRNIEELAFSPDRSVNLIGGPNGSGKSSILEAIFYACTARSFRGATDDILLRKGADVCRVAVKGEVNGRETEVECAWGIGYKRQIKVDGLRLPRVADLFDYFHAVSYVPEDTELIYGSPSTRRRMLDLYLSQADRQYLSDLLEYNRIITQRNALLKDFEISEEEESFYDVLEVWDQQLANVGARIIGTRLGVVASAHVKVEYYYAAIERGTSRLGWRYETNLREGSDPEPFLQKLRSCRKRDLYAGSTSVGPHRDDVTITLNDDPTRGFASQGEAKSAALAVKFALFDYLTERLGDTPILLLDELASDLDATRLAALLETLPQLGQVFLTTARPAELRKAASIQAEIAVRGGRLEEVS